MDDEVDSITELMLSAVISGEEAEESGSRQSLGGFSAFSAFPFEEVGGNDASSPEGKTTTTAEDPSCGGTGNNHLGDATPVAAASGNAAPGGSIAPAFPTSSAAASTSSPRNHMLLFAGSAGLSDVSMENVKEAHGGDDAGGGGVEPFADDHSSSDLVSSNDGHNSSLSTYADGASVIGSLGGDHASSEDSSDYAPASSPSTSSSDDNMVIVNNDSEENDVVETIHYTYDCSATYDRPLGMMVAVAGDEPGRFGVGKVLMKYGVPVNNEAEGFVEFEDVFEVVFKDGSTRTFSADVLMEHKIMFSDNKKHPDCKRFGIIV